MIQHPLFSFPLPQKNAVHLLKEVFSHTRTLKHLIDQFYLLEKPEWDFISKSLSCGKVRRHPEGFAKYGITFNFPTSSILIRSETWEEDFIIRHQRKALGPGFVVEGPANEPNFDGFNVSFMSVSVTEADLPLLLHRLGEDFTSEFLRTTMLFQEKKSMIALCLVLNREPRPRTTNKNLKRVLPLMILYREDKMLRCPPKNLLLNALTDLDLSDSNLSELPDLSALPALEKLVLSDNLIKEIPQEFTHSSLRELVLDRNQIVSLPSQLIEMKSLRRLSVHSNRLITFEAGQFSSSIEDLDLSWNEITGMLNFSQFYHLTKLDLSHNHVTVVDPKHLKKLSEIVLEDNSPAYPPKYLALKSAEAAAFLAAESTRTEMDAKRVSYLQLLRTAPGNDVCFDCESQPSYSIVTETWVFVCVGCYNAHRRFTWSHSRTINGNWWSWEDLVKLKAIGNRKSKEILKRTLPDLAARLGKNPHPYPKELEFREK